VFFIIYNQTFTCHAEEVEDVVGAVAVVEVVPVDSLVCKVKSKVFPFFQQNLPRHFP
jgi:hypothetical protein